MAEPHPDIVPAKRGDIVAIVQERSYASLTEGTKRWPVVRLAVVSGVTRDGFVKAADCVSPDGNVVKRFFKEKDIRRPQLVSRDRLKRSAAEIIQAVGDEFPDYLPARDALVPFVKTADEMRFEALPVRVQRIIDRCRRGEVLCKTLRRGEGGETEAVFSFHPSNATAGPADSQQAIESGFITPQDDGLFGAETSQTWRAA